MTTVHEAGRRFREGSLTPSRLVEECLDRIRRDNPRLTAFLEVFERQALEDAARATRELGEGRDRGPLHGIPVGIKDLFDVAGRVTTCGAHPGFHPPPAREDAAAVARLREAGAVLLGKTAMHEWAFGLTNVNPHFGPTRNPHDPSRVSGGSSGGSASAVAAGLCPATLGTDTGGSIRLPSALCGIAGLKPTRGLVDSRGLFPLSRTLDHVGPMAGNAEDAFLMLEALTGSRFPASSPPRVLLPEEYFLEEADPRIVGLVRETASRVGSVATVALEGARAAWEANTVILLSEAAALHGERFRNHPEQFGEDLVVRLKRGLGFSEADRDRALEEGRAWLARLERLLGDDAVLAVPGSPILAPPVASPQSPDVPKVLSRCTAPFNLAGTPALCVPCGTVDGLPVGIQLVAARGGEGLLRAAARSLEE